VRASVQVHGMANAKRRRHVALALLSTIVALGLFAAQASATLYVHPLVTSFGPKGVGSAAKFKKPGAVFVDQGSHDVYVTDREKKAGEPNLYRFASNGEPHPFTAGPSVGTNGMVIGGLESVAIAPAGSPGGTAGDIYLVVGGKVEVYSSTGAHLGTIDGSGNPNPGNTEAQEVITDGVGNLYIYYGRKAPEFTFDHLDKYVPSANPPKNSDFDSELRFEGNGIGDIAFAPGVFYGSTGANNGVTWFRYPLAFPGSGDSALAVPEGPGKHADGHLTTDSSNGDLYTVGQRAYETEGVVGQSSYESVITQYDDAGKVISFVVTPGFVPGFAVDATSGQLYIPVNNEEEKDVRIYGDGEPVEPPTSTIDPVSNFDFKSAHFSGTVNPGGSGELQKTAYRFHCKPECPGLQIGRTIPGDGVDHVVSDETSGLQPETSYEVQLIVRNVATTQDLEDKDWFFGNRAIPSDEEPGEVVATTTFETPAKPSAVAPEATIDPVSDFDSESAHLSGTVDPKGTGALQAASYRFEYSADGVKWTSAPEQGPIEGSGPQAVSTEIEGLSPNITYQVRLHAKNDGGEATSPLPNATFTTDAAGPLVDATDATHVLADSAQINGRIDPRGSHTTYYFQWGSGDCASSSCTSIPASKDADAGSGPSFVYVSADLSGLSPSTTYHYRLIAMSPAGEAVSQDASFSTEAPAQPCTNERSGFATTLPDCRTYELVSPVDKRGSDVIGLPLRVRSATDGDAVTYAASTSFGDSQGSTTAGVEYMSVRGTDSWLTHPLTPFQAPVEQPSGFSSGQFTGEFSPGLDMGIFRGLTPVPGTGGDNVAGVANLYLASGMRSGIPHFQLLSDAAEPVSAVPVETAPHINLAGASADFEHVIFETHDNLTLGANGFGDKAYEWSGGELRLVGILPDDACGAPPCIAPASVIGAGALVDLTFGSGTYTNLAHAISDDGSRIFFTARSSPDWGSLGSTSVGFAGSLYVRINGQSTVQVDATERSTPDPKGPGRSQFQMASPDGKTAFFLSREELVDGDTDGTGISLYRYEAEAPAGHHLSLVDTAGVEVRHIVAMTPDTGYIYFLGGQGSDLYVKHSGDVHRFAGGSADNLGQNGSTTSGDSRWPEARMSADGRRLLFGSNSDQGLYAPFNPGMNQLYFYDYASDEVECVSCSESGAPPTFPATFNGNWAQIIDPGGPATDPGLYNNTPMPSSGRHVFFSTRDSLVVGDTNGRMDAYSYDVETGKLALISTGQCNCDSIFLTANPSGRDVFFSTRQQLVRVDGDNLADVYDARIDGGIAAQNAPPPAECQGDACQPPPGTPVDVTPASASFNGPGTPAVKRPSKHRAKKHKKRRGKNQAQQRQRKQRSVNGKGRAGR
jgi:WD40-like Beta Propeller Repeat